MTYTLEGSGETLVVRPHGPLDGKGTPVVEAGIADRLDDITDLTIDLRDVGYMSSLGLRFLLSLQKRMFKQGTMHVINVNDEVMELLEETGFTQLMAVSGVE